MLDPWIIEEIKRREQSRRIEQPVVQIPARGPDPRDRGNSRDGGRSGPKPDREEDPRGVEIIDFGRASSSPPTTYSW
jgi:hypothetical protein